MIRDRVCAPRIGVTEVGQKSRNLFGPCRGCLSLQQAKQAKDFDESRAANGIGDDGRGFVMVLNELNGIEKILSASCTQVGGILAEKRAARVACAE